jgi:hypothetical protein
MWLFNILFFTFFLFVSEDKFEKITSYTLKANKILPDNLGYIYAVNNHEMYKYSPKGDLMFTYSNNALGNITYADITNPMKILLYYKDLSQVVFLDNTLSNNTVVSLEKYGLEQVTLVCTSINNGIWVFDQRTIQLFRLDKEMNIIEKTGNLNQVLGGEVKPVYITEKNNIVYLSDSERGIFMFDIFGTYLKTIPIKEVGFLLASGDNIYFTQNDILHIYNHKLIEEEELPLPEKDIKSWWFDFPKLYTLQNNVLTVYRVKN